MASSHFSKVLKDVFRRASSPSRTTKARRIHLILDFDGTLTYSDTLAVLGNIQPTLTRPKPSLTWNEIAVAYIQDYSTHEASYTPRKEDRRTLFQEREWLASLAPIESCSAQRVEEAGTFTGVTSSDIESTARKAVDDGSIKLRNGWQSLLTTGHDMDVSIMSVNWSRTFIKAVLLAAGARVVDQSRFRLGESLHKLQIHANEIGGLEREGGSDGSLEGEIRTSGDKVRVMKEIGLGAEEKPTVVYVGDSNTDLECLVEADVGICMRDVDMGSGQKSLAETLERLDIDVVPLDEITNQQEEGEGRKQLYWASDFEGIGRLLGIAE
ncbi:hypothetical protein NA57DRAFT_47016 [Rhizodiscina lignyota]|uniref:HAD-like protein n=1 Tax=Rhizodiscina lignyota TaxID=1504668 RepID=A0A9P4I721_9PEZI|nr:hypothetical protein NA57DRAFT_47016 [Rhizodiscina lignyota]